MNKLTLEQVRDDMAQIRSLYADTVTVSSYRMSEWADAIDAELKARGEPVAFRYLMPVGHAFAWTRWLDAETRHLHPIDDGRKVEYVYTAPPATKVEVTDVMVRNLARAMERDESEARAALEAALKDTP